ncbi:hypothetical protein [Methylobacterium sp. WL6]|uniref:hypothetical protein n=1 Tax=Methylobacterium sp. WL6 TaxID=2603901 RepID=UPI0011CB5420|nr:hypothetical protein [Methylobacterium sp. WL6]TXN72957.1 hypothetical protein FV230_02890 [Methylobacterium sp. WL6]
MSADTRTQVLAAIVTCMADAMAQGRDGFAAAAAEFPGTPGGVLGEAYAVACDAQEEAWWRTIERTIDGEVIREAVGRAGAP